MRLAEIVACSAAVSATRRRLDKFERLAEVLRRLEAHEARIGVAYLCGQTPQGKLGIGPAQLRETRDIEPAAEPTLTLIEVDRVFDELYRLSGRGAASARRSMLGELFGGASKEEQKFLRRLIAGELRQGALEGVVLEAVSRCTAVDVDRLRRAVMLGGDLAAVAAAALADGAPGVAEFGLRLMTPLRPMLAQPADDPATALADAGAAALEFKLDGARVQAHKDGDEVRVFTRHLNDVTQAAPEIVTAVRGFPAHRLILDGEALALGADARPLPFQVTMKRFGSRKEIERLSREMPLSPFFFDCLHIDGSDLIDRTARQRFEALGGVVPSPMLVPRQIAKSCDDARSFLARSLDAGHEGIVVKGLDTTYEAGARGASWFKVKPVHTLDLVVLAAEWGSGRRKGWLSNLHLGARDPANGSFVMLGKTFKGMTDTTLRWQTEQLLARELGRDGHIVFVRPELVVEVAFNDVQTSSHYPGGVALRFARLKRYRPDKPAAEADTIDSVRRIHQSPNPWGARQANG